MKPCFPINLIGQRYLLKFYLLFIVFAPFATLAQKQDSILHILNNYKTEDTNRVFYLSQVASNYSENDPELGLKYADSAIALSKKIKQIAKSGAAYMSAGYNYTAMGNDSAAIRYFEEAYRIYTIEKKSYFQASAMHSAGMSHYNRSQYVKSIECHKTSLEILKKLQNKKGIIKSLNSLGIIYMDQADYSRSIATHLEALKLAESEKDDSLSIAQSLMNLGLVYSALHDHHKALSYLQSALRINTKNGESISLANNFNNIGNSYDDLKMYDSSLVFYRQALEINEKRKNLYGIASNYINMGIVYSKTEKSDSAYLLFNKALPIIHQLGDVNNESFVYNELGDLILEAPDKFFKSNFISQKDRYKLALEKLNISLAMRQSIGSIDGMGDSHLSLSNTYEKMHQADSALVHYKLYVQYKDSIFNDKSELDIAKSELRFEYEKEKAVNNARMQSQVQLKQAEANKQGLVKNFWIAGFTMLSLSGAAAFILYKRYRDSRQKQKEIAATLRIKDTELKALRLQMNPHFIDNALQSIQHFMNEHKAEEAEEYLVKFSSLMRAMLMNSEWDEISLAKELETLEWYMQLENLRMNFPFTYKFNIDENIDAENTTVPPNILQPFVENSIKHGLLPKSSGGNIDIHIYKKENELHIIVEDDGVGRDNKNHQRSSTFFKRESLGIKITQERLNILNQVKNNNAAMRIIDLMENNAATGTRVELNLPL